MSGVASLTTVTGKIRCMHVRVGTEADGGEVARIQSLSPEAAQWEPGGYPVVVAEAEGCIVGLLVWREIAPDEAEILNLAVDPAFRRRGVARLLIAALRHADIFLEVRESNVAARALYMSSGFRESGVRFGYYDHPREAAIVMRLQK